VLDLNHMLRVDFLRCYDLDIDVVTCGDCCIGFGRTSPTANAACLSARRRGRWSCWCGRGRSSPPTRRRRGLLFRTNALLPLPARANARDLVVGEKREMAAHGKIHLTKQIDHFVAGDPELACHVVYAKLAQTILLAGSNRTRSMPLIRGGLDDGTDAFRELWIDDANNRRRFPTHRGPQLRSRRAFDHSNALCPKHRNNLVEAVVRGIGRNDGELQLATLRRITNQLHPDDYKPPAHSYSDQTE
jgi:hypothetical protein